MKLLTPASILLFLAISDATVLKAKKHHPNHHSTFIDETSGETIALLVQGYTGDVQTFTVASTFEPTTTFRHYEELSPDTSIIKSRDYCEKITNCVGLITDVAVFAAFKSWTLATTGCSNLAIGMSNYLTSNNYEQSKAIITGSIITLAWAPLTSVSGYFINAKLDESLGNKNDQCGEAQPGAFAANAASAMYQFCLSMQQKKMAQITTRYSQNDSPSADATQPTGIDGLMKFHIGTTEFDTGAVCRDFGVIFRRDSEAKKAGLVPKKVQF